MDMKDTSTADTVIGRILDMNMNAMVVTQSFQWSVQVLIDVMIIRAWNALGTEVMSS